MRIKLLVKPSESHSRVESFRGAYCTIGRKNSNVVVDDKRCSEQHLLLYQGPDGRMWAKDLESTNGSEVNGHRFSETVLQIGDEIRLGKTRVVVLNFEAAETSISVQKSSKKRTPKPVEAEEFTESQIIELDPRASSPSISVTEKASEPQRSHSDTPRTKTPEPEVLHSWPHNMLAQPRSEQKKFIEYLDEEGTAMRIALASLRKS